MGSDNLSVIMEIEVFSNDTFWFLPTSGS